MLPCIISYHEATNNFNYKNFYCKLQRYCLKTTLSKDCLLSVIQFYDPLLLDFSNRWTLTVS